MRIVWGSKYEERAIMPTFFAILFDVFFYATTHDVATKLFSFLVLYGSGNLL